MNRIEQEVLGMPASTVTLRSILAHELVIFRHLKMPASQLYGNVDENFEGTILHYFPIPLTIGSFFFRVTSLFLTKGQAMYM